LADCHTSVQAINKDKIADRLKNFEVSNRFNGLTLFFGLAIAPEITPGNYFEK
jgi:hypothetical protein